MCRWEEFRLLHLLIYQVACFLSPMPMRTLRLVSIIHVMTNKKTIHITLHGRGLQGKCAAYTGVSTLITWNSKNNHLFIFTQHKRVNIKFLGQKGRGIYHTGGCNRDECEICLSIFRVNVQSLSWKITRKRINGCQKHNTRSNISYGANGTKTGREKLISSNTCSQRAWRNSEYAIGLMPLNFARNECLMMSIIISQKKTIVAFCRVQVKLIKSNL